MTFPLRPLLSFTLLFAAACEDGSVRVPGRGLEGSGTAASEAREAYGFRSVSFALPGELIVVRGDREAVRIEADDNLLPHVETRVREGVLEIGSGRERLRPKAPLRVHVTATTLEGVAAAGSGSVDARGLAGDEVSVTVAGSGGLRAHEIDAQVLRAEVAGSGSAELAGRAARQVLTIAGSGSLHALELAGDRVDATIAGSGSAHVHARERLDANLVGSGSVLYRGDPEVTSRRVGSGSARPVDR